MGLLKNKKTRNQIFVFLAAAALFTACAGREKETKTDTPREAAEQVMRSVKELDLETFNAHTDNYEGTGWNLIGFTAEKEYKVFQELLQPRIFESKRYKEKLRFADKAVEDLTWEIGKIREEGGGRKASIEMTVTNKDMAEAIERYTRWIIEDAVSDAGLGSISLIKNLTLSVNECDDDLIRFIDETENTWTEDVTVTAYKENGVWKLHLTDEFINALMGNIDSEEYMDELTKELSSEYGDIGEMFE